MSKKRPKAIGSPELVKTEIKIKVIPRAFRNQIVGRDGDVFRVKVTPPPVKGMANRTLIEMLAKMLGISKGRIEITSGQNSRVKSVRIYGVSLGEITSVFEKHRKDKD